MHLKNFSLISYDDNTYSLAPAYDMIAAQLLLPDDSEELTLTLNGKKRKITKADFDSAMTKAHIPKKAMENLWGRIKSGVHLWPNRIADSFLEMGKKEEFQKLVKDKCSQLDLKIKSL